MLIYDAYRPWYVTKMFWDATPARLHTFVANPAKGSKHNRGCAVDLGLYDLRTNEPISMPSGYDEMTLRAHPGYGGGAALERAHRDALRKAMEAEGFTVDRGEWWHYDYKAWRQYPILNIPFERVGSGGKKSFCTFETPMRLGLTAGNENLSSTSGARALFFRWL